MTDNRNTRVLVVAAAVLALVLGFAYGATFSGGCELVKDAPFGCVEWWLARYQTLIAMFGAIFVAWLSVQPVLRQLKLSSLQTAVALQQVHADREKRLENWFKPELAVLEKLSDDLVSGYYRNEDDHAVLPHWVWNLNQTVDSTRDRLVQRQIKNIGSTEIAAHRQSLIDILKRLSDCMSDYNGSVYGDDPEYDLSDEDRAKIYEAEERARQDLPSRIDEVSVAIRKFGEAVTAEVHDVRKRRRFYDQVLASSDSHELGS
ncbi:hypothetical protein [Bradyrhizobium iriomotense]|uniref:hypothetical protein n=1 Tax=Bradyrhizobium iriomotense TaxID=441950 RepID=UPI001B8A8BE5|nr:hypothetical protein [Bradyrhizobium iriomotense]MBR1131910.1 hypothetical protein [Bradyrhizobium iriomotense]